MVRIFFLTFFFFSYSLQAECFFKEAPYFLIVLVSSPHLKTECFESFLQSLARHPRTGRKQGDPGHAWILLKGEKEDKSFYYHGGQTGHQGVTDACFLENVFLSSDRGEKNPAKYLHVYLQDGYFEEGSGGHLPTYAIYVPLEKKTFLEMEEYIHSYSFHKYALSSQNCVYFAGKLASLAGICLLETTSIELPSAFKIGNTPCNLYEDPKYRNLKLLLPDTMEKKMRESVLKGEAKECLKWYKSHFPLSFKEKVERIQKDVLGWKENFLRFCKTCTIQRIPHNIQPVIDVENFSCNSGS